MIAVGARGPAGALTLVALSYASYMLVSLAGYLAPPAALYAPLAAGIVAGLMAPPRASAPSALLGALLGAATFMVYYAISAPVEFQIMVGKLGAAAMAPLAYSAAMALVSAAAASVVVRRLSGAEQLRGRVGGVGQGGADGGGDG